MADLGESRGRTIQTEDFASSTYSRSVASGRGGRNHSRTRGWGEDVEVNTLNTTKPRDWLLDLSNLPKHFGRQIFGLNPFKTSYFSLYRPLKTVQTRLILGCAIVFSIAAGVPLPLIGYVFGKIINDFPPPEDELLMRLLQLIGIAIGYFVVTWIWSVCWGIVGENVSRGLREDLVKKALGMDMAYFDVEAPDITSVLTADTQTIQTGTSEKVGLFIQSISYFVAAFIVGFILNAELTGILFGAIIPAMFLVVISGTTTVSILSKKTNNILNEAGKIAEAALDAIQVVQAFGAFQILSDQHISLLAKAARTGFRKGIAGATMLGAVYFLAYAANALAFWKGSKLVDGHGAGTVYAVVFLILDASFVIGQFGPFIQSLALAASAGGKVLDLIDRAAPTIDVYSEEGLEADDQCMQQDIHFENVTFVYPSRPAARVLNGVNLRFVSGETTAIVGPSGSGKSTVASLLLRLYDVSTGSVKLGDINIKEFNIRSLRSRISLVDQEPVLFTGTILENISHGILNVEQLSEEEVLRQCIRAATDANADFISNLSHGIHTKIGGAGGTTLSGGQKQRICLARALVRNPSTLILDEPTSALDSTSEALILEALRSVAERGCTVITIAHRLATIRDSNKIIVMEEGHVVEEGTHEKLMNEEGAYSRLVEAQKIEREAETSNQSGTETPISQPTYDYQRQNIQMDLEKSPDLSSLPEVETPVADRMSNRALLKRCFAISRPERGIIALGVFGSMLSGALIIGEAIIFGNLVSLINAGQESAMQDDKVNFYCLMFFVVALLAFCAYSTSGSAFGLVSENLIRRTRDISFRTILRQDIAWFAEAGHSTQELIATVSTDSSHLSGLSGVILGTIFSVSTSIIGGIILAHVVAWKIAVVLLSAMPVMIVAGFTRLRVLAKFEERHESAYNDAAALASEACRAIRTVAAFGREYDILAKYQVALYKPYRSSFKFIIAGNLMLAFSLAITYFVYALAYWWGARQVREGLYNQQQFFTVLPALLFSAQAAGQMFSLAPEVTRAKAAAKSVFSLHDEKPSILPSADQEQEGRSFKTGLHNDSEGSTLSQSGKAQLKFDRISFAYPARPDAPVLKDISFTIQAGEFIGIVGASGAGKSSVVALAERFYDPTEGSITFEGDDIQNVPVEDYRARLSLVPQEPALFTGSIRFNITMGARPGEVATQEDVETVCRQLNIHTFIMSLPHGYETDCGFNGSQLSGGQKQRVAIARALVRDPRVLLLDEATASLDAHSEDEVQDAVAVAKEKGTTTIVVAHRLRSVQKADRLLVFDKGKLVEQGTHDDLVSKGGMYAAMVLAQDV